MPARCPTGGRFFAMEYVEGKPITVWCDEQRLTPEARMRLFVQVCEAVEHAHQKGIIHRDLKPTNVLVTDREGKPLPKVIDFGIARATAESDEERTLLTEIGRFVGTPAYMSPEQASLDAADIDTRTDIYSLGAILYELLVGALPFEPTALLRSGYAEMQRVICEEDPPRPSVRFERLGPTSTAHALKRKIDPPALVRRLRGDPDWITMKALEKDRARRYASAGAFAQDVLRHLRNEPVEARPPSRTYRLKKFVRRNRTAVGAGALLLGMLVAGLAVSTKLFFEAEDARDLAETRLAKVQRMADKQLLADLRADADALWPALPDRIEAMEGWLRRADGLLARLPDYRTRLQALQARGRPVPRSANDETMQRVTRLRAERSARERDLRDIAAQYPEPLPPQIVARRKLMNKDIERLASEIEPLEAELARRQRLGFDDVEDQDAHDLLEVLVDRMSTLASDDGLHAQVRDRVREASEVYAKTIDAHADAWAGARERVRADARFGGLQLVPQVGLVPLGLDPISNLEEFAVLATGDVPQRDLAGGLQLTDEFAVVLVLVPGGTFRIGAQRPTEAAPLGSPNVDPGSGSFEQPVHDVTLDPYFLSKFEMTQAQYMRVMSVNPSTFMVGRHAGKHVVGLRHPVETVDWHDARRALHRVGLELPTEAQWERAARAGTNAPWFTGERVESIKGYLNVADMAAVRDKTRWAAKAWRELDDGHVAHAPVGTYMANPWGLHDTMGNVKEWCLDNFGRYDAPHRPGDGLRLEYYDGDLFATRSCSYSARLNETRVAYRGATKAAIAETWLGFRPARRLGE